MKKFALLLLFISSFSFQLSAFSQTSGQWRFSKRNANGTYTDHGVTWANGEIVYLTGGVPTALTLNANAVGLGNVENAAASGLYEPLIGTGTLALSKLATDPLARANHTGTQLLSTISDAGTLAGLSAVASAQITNGTIVNEDINAAAAIDVSKISGLGAAALLGVSTGGNSTTDSGKVVIFGTDGSLQATGIFNLYNSSGALAAQITPSALALSTGTSFFAILRAPANSTTYDLYLPTTPGNLIGTGDTATVTNTMLAGSIDLTTKVTGALPVANGGTAATTAAAARVSLLPSMTGNAGKVLAVNGGETDYELATISAGLTINTSTTSGASAGDILTSDGSLLQKLTPGTGVSTWLATPTLANLNSAVSDADVAITAANTFSAAQTISLSALGTTPAGGLILINPTAATSGNQQYSPVLQLTGEGYTTGGGSVTHNWYAIVKPTQYTGTLPIGGGFPELGYLQIFGDIDGAQSNVRTVYTGYNDLKLDLHGCLWLNAYGGRMIALGGTPSGGTTNMSLDTSSGIFMSQNHRFGWVTGFNAYAASDFEFARLTTNTLALTDYTTGGTMLAVMLTHTSATSYEAGVIDTITTANTVRIGSAVGSGGGTARDVHLIHGGTVKASLTSSGFVIGSGGSAISKVKHGVATLVAGTVTVSDSDVVETGTEATSSRIFVQRMTDGGTVSTSYSITRINTTSFTVTGLSTDTSVIAWEMINP